MTTPSTKVQPGDVLLDKYRVDRVLGQGGMGVVVLAEHIELRERVAIKFLLDTAGDNSELAERFLREARAAVKIKSEHVVRVSDVGRLPSGAPYMVMEYLEGEDLSQRLLSGVPVPIEDAVDYLIQCCEAMLVAHRSGIVHRDLKPANLFLTQRPDGSSLIKVLDFGISKVKQDAAQLSLTHTQAMMGSPLYMSPEQMRSSKDVSPSADIWSIGVILHELLSGDLPFMGDTFPEVLVKVMSEDPPRVRSLRAQVPEGLEAVVLRCLEKDPADRYASVAHLGVALAPYGSPRTLGLQARLRSGLSRPPPAPSPRLLDSTFVPELPVGPAIASTMATLESRVVVPEVPTAKTNTAWVGSSAAPTRASSWRRHRALWIGAGASLVLGLGATSIWVSSMVPSASVPAGSAAASAAPKADGASPRAASAPAAAAPLPEPAPAHDVVAAPAAGASAELKAVAVEHAEPPPPQPSIAPIVTAGETASVEHPPVPATAMTEASAHAARAAPTKATAAAHKPSVGKMPKGRVTAAVSAGAAPARAAAPAPALAAPAKARSKALSIEFK
jgi:eukaryotic-like serine/threonine-protein kinase